MEKVQAGGTLEKYVDREGNLCITKTGSNMYRWIHQVVFQNLPFSFVDKKGNQEISCLKPISSKSLKEAMSIISKKVESFISVILPEQFAFIFDGRRSGDTHFVGIFVTFMQKDQRNLVLLSISPM